METHVLLSKFCWIYCLFGKFLHTKNTLTKYECWANFKKENCSGIRLHIKLFWYLFCINIKLIFQFLWVKKLKKKYLFPETPSRTREGAMLCTRHAHIKYIIDNRMFTIQFKNGRWSENFLLKKLLKREFIRLSKFVFNPYGISWTLWSQYLYRI